LKPKRRNILSDEDQLQVIAYLSSKLMKLKLTDEEITTRFVKKPRKTVQCKVMEVEESVDR
jgi:hypothetical protein